MLPQAILASLVSEDVLHERAHPSARASPFPRNGHSPFVYSRGRPWLPRLTPPPGCDSFPRPLPKSVAERQSARRSSPSSSTPSARSMPLPWASLSSTTPGTGTRTGTTIGKEARARIACPDGLSPTDEFYLWGLLSLTFSRPLPSPDFYATPYYCLRRARLHRTPRRERRRQELRPLSRGHRTPRDGQLPQRPLLRSRPRRTPAGRVWFSELQPPRRFRRPRHVAFRVGPHLLRVLLCRRRLAPL